MCSGILALVYASGIALNVNRIPFAIFNAGAGKVPNLLHLSSMFKNT